MPRNKFATVAALLKATYAQEDREASLAKVKDVERKLREMKLNSPRTCTRRELAKR